MKVVRLISQVSGKPLKENFAVETVPVADVKDGEVKVKILRLSADPYMITLVSGRSTYMRAFLVGDIIRNLCVGRIVESKSSNPEFAVGTLVGLFGPWAEYAVGRPAEMNMHAIPAGIEPSTALSAIGLTGLTAYHGLFDVGKIRAGETLVVSTAGGAVGGFAVQIAKIAGCRVIGITSTEEKAKYVVGEYGADACIKYRTENVGARLKELCPNGIDVYFDNVGGETTDTILRMMNSQGRVIQCGAISTYLEKDPTGPRNEGVIVFKCLTVQGFLVSNFTHLYPRSRVAMANLVKEGRIKIREVNFDGLDRSSDAFAALFDGSNDGKVVIRVAEY